MVDRVMPSNEIQLKPHMARVFNNVLGLNISPAQIEQAFIYRRSENNDDPPTIQICFNTATIKKQILSLKHLLVPTKIYVKEHLTPLQSAIYYQARMAKRNGLIFNCWTGDGFVYGSHNETSPEVRISSLELITARNEEYYRQHPDKRQ